MNRVFLGLGGNVGDPLSMIRQAVSMIEQRPGFHRLRLSKLYRSTPVHKLDQPMFVNAACRVETSYSPKELLKELQDVQRSLGQGGKPKNFPRLIDIDILFYGETSYFDTELEVPHPRWKERLFVLKPLADLVETLQLPGGESVHLPSLLKVFDNPHNETVYEVTYEKTGCS